ncbi:MULTISPECIES: glycerophosphodiester phosphodiesterase [unclassified Streptomyces]|uniref:glycerophosphodiester phosphodiesterase n=1 Tax=unclassified Streptomyces TaxID=2593676 RepID=UPI001908C9A1|nr:glycerophosphodiester phosphodiesterase family protein [Streptomyces sp. HSG2]
MDLLTIGHRGMAGVEPENTLRSFVAAERAGLDAVELDLHLSKDGALIVIHDAEVDRTTDGSGPVAEKTLAELRALDAGGGERVPVFEEVLEAVSLPIQAEIKDVAAARTLAGTMLRLDLADRVEVISFHDEAIVELARLVPGARTALVAQYYGPEVVDRAVAAGARTLCLDVRRLTLETVARARAARLRVLSWTVNTDQELRLVRTLELDGATTDRPEIHRAARAAS